MIVKNLNTVPLKGTDEEALEVAKWALKINRTLPKLIPLLRYLMH